MIRFLSNFFYNIFLLCFIISIFGFFHSETKGKNKVLAGVDELHESLIKISNKTINSDNLAMIDDVVKNSYDLEKMGGIIIGVDWKKIDIKTQKEFINVFKNLTIFVDRYDETGNIKKIYINEKLDQNSSKIIVAESGIIQKRLDKFMIKLFNYHIKYIKIHHN